MKKKLIMAAVAVAGASALYVFAKDTLPSMNRQNPLLSDYQTQYEIPPFDKIQMSDYMPALREAINLQKAEVKAIVENPETPNFENTILALDNSGELLNRIALLFSGLDEALNSPESEEVAATFYSEAQKWADEMAMNPELFARIESVYNNREAMNLTTPQLRLVEKTYKNAVRNGAKLSAADQDSLKAINSRLTDLYLKFNKNLLAATNEFVISITDTARLAGLPQGVIDAAAEAAAERNLPAGTYAFTLHGPSRLPVLQYAADRDLRRQRITRRLHQRLEAGMVNEV
ncbi:MAG: peptidase M3, partial [Muribaculaceae bacterium]|nr:peptidase M3 [Muribaculaceae bacterium]